MTAHEEPERDAVRYRVVVRHPHVTIFLIAADVIQCLRTALDQAVCSLVSLKHADPDWTQFPVFSEPLNPKERKRFDSQTRGLPSRAIDYISCLQPYNRPQGTPVNTSLLWQLHEWNRIDKHRRISVRTSVTVPSRVVNGAPGPDFLLFDLEPADYGCDVICGGAYKNLEPRFAPIVVFGEANSGITITLPGIVQIYHFVADEVLPTLAGFAQ